MRGSRSALLPLSVLLENFLCFRIASLEHNASSAERVLPAPFAKVRIISKTNKLFEDFFLFIQASGSVFVRTSGTHGFNKVDLSIPIGLSYEISDFVIDARYNFGLTHIYKDDPGSSKNGVIMLTEGYKIPL